MALIATIEADFNQAWGEIETDVEDSVLAVWNLAKPIITCVTPEQWKIILPLFGRVAFDIATDNIGDIISTILNEAAPQEAEILSQIESRLLTGILVLVSASKKA